MTPCFQPFIIWWDLGWDLLDFRQLTLQASPYLVRTLKEYTTVNYFSAYKNQFKKRNPGHRVRIQFKLEE